MVCRTCHGLGEYPVLATRGDGTEWEVMENCSSCRAKGLAVSPVSLFSNISLTLEEYENFMEDLRRKCSMGRANVRVLAVWEKAFSDWKGKMNLDKKDEVDEHEQYPGAS